MPIKQHPSFFMLLLLISFPAVNAVLFTPGLPNLTSAFNISTDQSQYTLSFFLIGYALGQLIYGPLANRFGRKPTIYSGICLQILSSLLCVLAGKILCYPLLILGRLLLALGAGVGLKMTFTLVNDCYPPQMASKKISYLTLAFAITPGISIALGGLLNEHYGWISCFYAGAFYGFLLLLLMTRLPETLEAIDQHALKIKNLLQGYARQFKTISVVAGGLMMGMVTSYIYVFASIAPFIAMNILGMTSTEYGIANMLPTSGLVCGSLFSAHRSDAHPVKNTIYLGIIFISIGLAFMAAMVFAQQPATLSLFLPMTIVYFGLALILANASSIAMGQASNKSQAAAVMSFVNMSTATVSVLSMGFFVVSSQLMLGVYLSLLISMICIYRFILR